MCTKMFSLLSCHDNQFRGCLDRKGCCNIMSMQIEEVVEGVRLVSCFVPTLLTYLTGKVRSREEKSSCGINERESGNLQLEFEVLSKSAAY